MTRRRKASGRKVGTREIRPRFLIVCEGQETERHYFQAFQAPGLVVRVAPGAGNTTQVIDRAIELRDGSDNEYDQVWCVFDRDDFPVERFNRALQLAKREQIQVAYSNEAFELWLLLHFGYVSTALSRADYVDRLSQQLGKPYRKNDRSLYDELEPRQPEALRNARRLLASYERPNPAEDNPSTTVHLLVEELNRHRRP